MNEVLSETFSYMAYKTKQSKLKSIKKYDFFEEVSSRCNYLPVDIIKDVYYSMIKTIVQEMKKNVSIKLPDFGEFVLQMHKERNALNLGTGRIEFLPRKRTIKFKVIRKLKDYLNKYNL